MELKYGISTYFIFSVHLLIAPYGIEIGKKGNSLRWMELLIAPYGIEILSE